MENSKISFILASASPRRKELIGHLKIPFEVITLNVPEESNSEEPWKFCSEISELKGEAVLRKLSSERQGESIFVVSADTIVSLGPKIYGKPRDREEARRFLSELSNRTHSVFTAATLFLLHNGQTKKLTFVEESKVTFSNITPVLMEKYLDTRDSLDKAGAYGIQGPSLTFISKVDGDYANVVGFPLSRFVKECETFFRELLKEKTSWFDLF